MSSEDTAFVTPTICDVSSTRVMSRPTLTVYMDTEERNILDILQQLRNAGVLLSPERAEAAEQAARAVAEQDDDELAWNLQKLAQLLATAGEWDNAEIVAQSIPTAYEKAAAFYRIAPAGIAAGEAERVVRLLFAGVVVAGSIAESWQRAETLGRIARIFMAAHERDVAMRVWDEAITVARAGQDTDDSQGGVDCSSVLREIARELVAAGEGKKAIEAARSIKYGFGGLDAVTIIAKIVKERLFS